MNASSFVRVSALSLFAGAFLALPACSGAPAGEHESLGTDTSALVDHEVISFGADNLTLATFLLNPLRNGTTVVAAGNQVTITPNPSLAALLSTPKMTFALPTYSTASGSTTATVQSVDGSLDMSTLQLAMVGPDLVVTVKGNATVAFETRTDVVLTTLTAHPTLHVPELDVTMKVAWNAATKRFFVESGGVTVDMPGESTSDCGAFGWCNDLFNNHLGDIKTGFANAVATGFASILATTVAGQSLPTVSNAFRDVSELACQALVPSTSLAATAFSLDALSLANGKVTCTLSRTIAPAPFGPCSIGSAGVCSGSVVADCGNVSTSETYTLQHLSGTSWTNVAASWLPPGGTNGPTEGALVANGQTVTTTGAESYRVCASNAAGTSCSPAMSLDLHTSLKCCSQPTYGCPASLPHWNATTCKCDKGFIKLVVVRGFSSRSTKLPGLLDRPARGKN